MLLHASMKISIKPGEGLYHPCKTACSLFDRHFKNPSNSTNICFACSKGILTHQNYKWINMFIPPIKYIYNEGSCAWEHSSFKNLDLVAIQSFEPQAWIFNRPIFVKLWYFPPKSSEGYTKLKPNNKALNFCCQWSQMSPF